MTIDIPSLMASIRAGEDTTLELKEVAFRGRRMLLGGDGVPPAARLAEVFASMANTEGGTLVLGVRDGGVPTGIESDKRDLVEQLVINAATENCQPMVVPRLDWEFLPREDGSSRLCLIIGIHASTYDVHQTADGRYLQRIGSHRRPIPGPQLARLLSSRRLAEPVEERPVINASLDDLDGLRLRRHFLRRFPDWTPPDNWPETLTAHKLAVEVENRVLPTCVGIATMQDLRAQGRGGRLGARMTAVVIDGQEGKEYRLASEEELVAARMERTALDAFYADIPFNLPEESTPAEDALGIRTTRYGLDTWDKLFTHRQLLAIGAFAKQIRHVRDEMADCGYPAEWREALVACLAPSISRLADRCNTLATWTNDHDKIRSTFARFALPMVWDFAESCPLTDTTGGFGQAVEWIARVCERSQEATSAAPAATAMRQSAIDIRAGFVVTGSWPIRTERENRQRSLSSAALASSIWIVCRKRPAAARAGWDRRVLAEMRDNITTRLREFWDAGIRGPDFVWAATGPALEAYGRHPVVKITDSPGRQLTVAEFLRHVRRMVVGFVVSRLLSPDGGTTDELDDVTTYYLLHRNDFSLKPVSGGACILYKPCPAISPIRISQGGWTSWFAAVSGGPCGTTATIATRTTPRPPAAERCASRRGAGAAARASASRLRTAHRPR